MLLPSLSDLILDEDDELCCFLGGDGDDGDRRREDLLRLEPETGDRDLGMATTHKIGDC